MKVSFILGSESDREFVQPGVKKIAEAGVDSEVVVHSAHRDLPGLLAYLKSLKGVQVIIAVAGMSAALPGIVAASTDIPVIGVPRAVGPLGGIDALLSMVQMPKGVPVATMGIGEAGIINAAELALRILKISAKRGEL
jgi:phosphoribosylaminoimidazole carboxylase PurE protein